MARKPDLPGFYQKRKILFGAKTAPAKMRETGKLFMDAGRTHVSLEPGLSTAVIQGNTFRGRAKIVNDSQANVQIGLNAEQAPPVEEDAIIIDDMAGNDTFTAEGEWVIGKGGNDYLDALHWAKKGGGECRAVWRPRLPKSGLYSVCVWYGGDPMNDHATDAPFTVHGKDGDKRMRVNLKENTGRWNLLGDFRFKKGRDGCVTTANDANGNVLADAVKFVLKKSGGH